MSGLKFALRTLIPFYRIMDSIDVDFEITPGTGDVRTLAAGKGPLHRGCFVSLHMRHQLVFGTGPEVAFPTRIMYTSHMHFQVTVGGGGG